MRRQRRVGTAVVVASAATSPWLLAASQPHGLVRVEIPSARWAMDNLVWVPEPGPVGLLSLGLAALGWARMRKRWQVADER
ncbi:MAG: PEP-CTERM sorting domain-containing protein [Limisphaera sp.]